MYPSLPFKKVFEQFMKQWFYVFMASPQSWLLTHNNYPFTYATTTQKNSFFACVLFFEVITLIVRSINNRSVLRWYLLDTIQDFLSNFRIKWQLNWVKNSTFPQKNFFGRSTYVLQAAIEKSWFLTFKVNFLCQKLSESF